MSSLNPTPNPTNNTLAVHLSDLREAAAALRRSGQRIELAAGTVRLTLDELALLAPDTLPTRYRGATTQWLTLINYLADKLNDAADEIERAATERGPIIPISIHALAENAPTPTFPPIPTRADAPMTPFIGFGGYVAAVNRPLYDQLTDYCDQLSARQEQLADLTAQRAATVSDLEALRSRLLSHDLPPTPAVETLHANIAQIDGQLDALHADIRHLQIEAADLNERLARVQPGPHADLSEIAALEGAETAAWIQQGTFDCVHYIVHRLSIPPGIARDAYRWLESTLQFPQYGIQQGAVPLVGSVLVLSRDHSWADDQYGHLFYVDRIVDGVPWVSDNYHPDAPIPLTDLTTEISGPHLRYLYFPWHTRA